MRTARQVTHPNVCRVYDTGEFEGQHFLSMEYVDGEDLASLLRRIGRLPAEKAVQIARQLCAGLAASHDQGFLHRDLKPANVMLDGRGQVKITDFGLAGLAEGFSGAEIRAGTPTYMAPEQLAGREVTLKSDIYSLGVVLYELFTGKPAYKAGSAAELSTLHETTPTNPSTVVDGLDPAVERVILRCMEQDPDRRPQSALAVAAALPGGDPLSAALAAGETPSPDMVAAAGGEGGVRPLVAVACLVVILLAIAGSVVSSQRYGLLRHFSLDLPPDALVVEARQILDEIGHDAERVDSARGLSRDGDYFEWATEQEEFAGDWEYLGDVRPAPLYLWYREGPHKLVPTSLFDTVVTDDHPPRAAAGSAAVWLDIDGRLTRLEIVPPAHDASEGPWPEPDWGPLLARSGLDTAALEPARAEWNPLLSTDRRVAWTGNYPDQPDLPMRIEAGSFHGKPVYFEVIPPWKTSESTTAGAAQKVQIAILITLLFGVLLGAAFLARRNLRLGRGDRKGAFRVGTFVFAGFLLQWVIGGDHSAHVAEVGLILDRVAWGLLWGASAWTVYVALEPYARRLWPDILIAWTRLLSGRYRDPLVGRSILVGGVCMAALVVINEATRRIQSMLAAAPDAPVWQDAYPLVLSGVRQTVSVFLGHTFNLAVIPLGILFLLVVFRMLFRKPLPAMIGLVVVFSLPAALASDDIWVTGAINLLVWTGLAFVLTRFGLLAIVAWITFNLVSAMPMAADTSVWFFGRTVVALIFYAALTGYGFWISLAGRPLLARDLLEEPARP